MKKLMIAAAVAVSLLIPSLTRAHEGHAHKAMGTISSVEGNHLMVKTTDGKTVMVMLDDKTKITQGKDKIDAKALKVGDRVVAEGPEQQQMIMAATVKVGEAAAAAAKK